MELEQLKKLRTLIKDENIFEFLSLILNSGILLPNTYMFINIFLNEMKKNNEFPVISIPYLTMMLYSSLKIDLELDKKIHVNKIK